MPSPFTYTQALRIAAATPDLEALNLPLHIPTEQLSEEVRRVMNNGIGLAVMDMQAKAISEEIQIPGGTMHYAFGMQALSLIAWNPEPIRLSRDINYLNQRIHDSLDSWSFEHASAYDNFNATRVKVTAMDARLVRRNVPTAFSTLFGLTLVEARAMRAATYSS
eukprot:4834692-Pleurochrysis_carterae.AAC.1